MITKNFGFPLRRRLLFGCSPDGPWFSGLGYQVVAVQGSEKTSVTV